MSYAMTRGHVVRGRVLGRGLGDLGALAVQSGFRGVPAAGTVALPMPGWQTASYGDPMNKQNDVYRKVGDDNVLNQIQQRLIDVYAMNPADAFNTDDGHFSARRNYRDWMNNLVFEIREDGPFLQALKSYWVRQGRNDNLWPGSGGQTDFGPNTNNSRDLQIAQSLYAMLANPSQPLWQVYPGDGFVRLRSADYLYNGIIRNALIAAGYLKPGTEINTKDDGPIVQALEAFYREGVASGRTDLNYGRWASDTGLGPNTAVNFGPNTNTDEVRISPELITSVLSGWSARTLGTAAQRTAAQAAFATATIRPPLLGMVSDTSRPAFNPRTVLSPSLVRSLATTLAPVLLNITIGKK